MATPLLPDALWSLIEPLLPTPAPKPQVEDHAYPTALASRAFCLYCEAVFLGGCCSGR